MPPPAPAEVAQHLEMSESLTHSKALESRYGFTLQHGFQRHLKTRYLFSAFYAHSQLNSRPKFSAGTTFALNPYQQHQGQMDSI